MNRTRKVAELASGLRNPNMSTFGPLLGTCSVAQSRILRFQGIVETNREKVAAPAFCPQAGAVFRMSACATGGLMTTTFNLP